MQIYLLIREKKCTFAAEMRKCMQLGGAVCRWALALFIMFAGANAWAQSDFEEGYNYLYSTAHRIKVRKVVECISENQQLWNGAQVRIIDDEVCIFRDGTCVTRGLQVWLEHTGSYTVQNDEGVFCLTDSIGRPTGVHGDEILMLWNGVACVLQGNKYYLYTSNNKRIGSLVSDKPIEIYYDGYYCYHKDGFYCVVTPSGELINNSYSDSKPELLDVGVWRCKRDGRAFFVDILGNIGF